MDRLEDVGLGRENVELVIADRFEHQLGNLFGFYALVERGLEERRELLDVGYVR